MILVTHMKPILIDKIFVQMHTAPCYFRNFFPFLGELHIINHRRFHRCHNLINPTSLEIIVV